MIKSPDVNTLRAMARLEYNEDYKLVMQWLRDEHKNISLANDAVRVKIDLRRGQGAALLLSQFLTIQDDAEKTLSIINR